MNKRQQIIKRSIKHKRSIVQKLVGDKGDPGLDGRPGIRGDDVGVHYTADAELVA